MIDIILNQAMALILTRFVSCYEVHIMQHLRGQTHSRQRHWPQLLEIHLPQPLGLELQPPQRPGCPSCEAMAGTQTVATTEALT